MHQGDGTEQERIAVQLGQRLYQRALYFGVEHGVSASHAQLVDEFAFLLHQIHGFATHAVGPDHFADSGVGQFSCDDHFIAQRNISTAEHEGRVKSGVDFVGCGALASKSGGAHARDHANVLAACELCNHAIGNELTDHKVLG